MRGTRRVWEPSSERGGTTIVSRLALTNVSNADVAHERRIEITSLTNLLQGLEDESVERCVLQRALVVFAERCSERQRNDYIVRVLLKAGCLG